MTARLVGYNLATPRERGRSVAGALDEIEAELNGLVHDWHPVVIGLCEAIDYRALPGLRDYRQIRDRSRAGRANIAAFVHVSVDLKRLRWHDLSKTWAATEGQGTHPARSYLELVIDDPAPDVPDRVDVLHMPPYTRHGAGSSYPARAEMAASLETTLHGRLPRRRRGTSWAAVGDYNASHDAMRQLADQFGGHPYGDTYDAATGRGLDAELRTVTHAHSVPMRSDHGRASVLTIRHATHKKEH